MERLQQDSDYAEQLVDNFIMLQEENEKLMTAVSRSKQVEKEAQLALRQAKGFNLYLKNKEISQRKIVLERQSSSTQAEEATVILKITNKELRDRLDEAKKSEGEAKLALRQARGITKYLKQTNSSLEKQLDAAKEEQTAKMALREARTHTFCLKDTMKENGFECSEHSRDFLSCDSSLTTAGSFDLGEFDELAEMNGDLQSVPDELRLEMTSQA